MKNAILFVDDEPYILSCYQRQLRHAFSVDIAESGAAALEMIASPTVYAVVVADMRMPNMDGIQFLGHVKQRSPHTVRMMLTGNADLDTAIQAVNEGAIFRFLTKPCQPETLIRALQAGVEQYRLLEAERELLERTLRGSVKVLTDALSLLNPAAFSRATRIRARVRRLAEKLQIPSPWQCELAAMLSQIGCVTLPPPVLERALTGRSLLPEEQRMYAAHPTVGADLLSNVPRLERVARMVEGQQRPYRNFARNLSEDERLEALGAQLLKLCLDYDGQLQQDVPVAVALERLRTRKGEYNPRMLAALRAMETGGPDVKAVREVSWTEIKVGMVATEPVRTSTGALVVPKDQEFTPEVLTRLRNFAQRGGLVEPLLVYERGPHLDIVDEDRVRA